jgi:undecaprenyl phosphate-alpha-L-ara4FN deformylase
VDVDTFRGMKTGAPALLALFDRYDVKASFFVPMGKDHTGRTVKRVFTRKGFLKKAGRVGVVSTYGVKTLMYGLLLRGPEIARQNRPLLQTILDKGHELGIHGHDHVYWHDHIKGLGREKTESELSKALSTYEEIVGTKPVSFAAPGWMINVHALRFLKGYGIRYSSDTRGNRPFFPSIDGERIDLLQIPTTLPTLDEVVGVAGSREEELAEYFLGSLGQEINILTVHTELEGRRWIGFLARFVERALEKGYRFMRLIDIAAPENNRGTPVSAIAYGSVEGRAGEVCRQSGDL